MNTQSMQTFLARLSEDDEPVVTIDKTLLAPAEPGNPDRRGLYQVTVRVQTK